MAPLLAAAGHFLHPRVDDLVAIATAAAVTTVCAVVLGGSQHRLLVHWFGGWTPRNGVALGISFSVDPFGAGLALLAAVLVTASLVFSWRYFDEAGKLYPVLMLVFLAGMCGFAYTGDLFNLFVFFELMGVAAYALTAYDPEESGPIEGAFNFAVTNSVGAFLILFGIALLYGRFGALNLAQLGESVTHHGLDGLAVVALALLLVGLLVKAAAVPFHFWLADAHAMAPAPVCVLFSGAMVELGLYGALRVYWTVFAGAAEPQADRVRAVLVGLGVVTALVGAAMCFLQRHLKRMLAYSTISHAGLFLVGAGTLDPKATAGAALWVLSHGLLKGSLFLAAGIVLHRLGDVDELRLHGRGRELRAARAVFFLGAAGLVGLPFVGGFSGHSLVEEGASSAGVGWVSVVLVLASVVTCAAILRAGARVFLGMGAREDPLLSPEPPERDPGDAAGGSLALMNGAALVLLVLGLAVSLVPGLEGHAEAAAGSFQNTRGYAVVVLRSAHQYSAAIPFRLELPPLSSILLGLLSGAGAVALAAASLRPRRRRVSDLVARPLAPLRAAHSGLVTDYVAWATFGTAVLGGLLALLLR
ncbi:MAG: multicomponent Na+:H+ antiporter subunit [Gaiellaceae bacterium]|nr:multicomponent Na+:H+ antiporter subunit [Gaiellaceae bacterium]